MLGQILLGLGIVLLVIAIVDRARKRKTDWLLDLYVAMTCLFTILLTNGFRF